MPNNKDEKEKTKGTENNKHKDEKTKTAQGG